jgi:hypothetical protein
MESWNMKIATLLLPICLLTLTGVSSGQDFNDDWLLAHQ